MMYKHFVLFSYYGIIHYTGCAQILFRSILTYHANANFFTELRQPIFADYVLHTYRHNEMPNVEVGFFHS